MVKEFKGLGLVDLQFFLQILVNFAAAFHFQLSL